ncbi:hypothetical protein BUALT_Bualt18G0041900 [Buddleja alternifolia]|uniref:MULE transposase domain-containing protein n=1 Tax=Buddleja alternifolia TaxID=168488 RepID=A0AAV6WD27_9LAMI|nr:hypothetical protein BUALT_Bualt18G0041900 [Buddleja alternifolia]
MLDGCRPIIGLDGYFLKGLYKGQLLIAVGRDRNDNIYPIAFALVKVEKFDTWEWFLNLLLREIGSQEERGWAFISDRQKGLFEAVGKLAPRVEHRFCLRHMYNNLKGSFKGEELKMLFWRAASTFNVRQYQRVMREIERVHPKRGDAQTPYEWMNDIPAIHWAKCFFFSRTKCDVLVNNISESFNSYSLDARELPIINMFEWIRRKLPGMNDYEESALGVVDPPNVVRRVGRSRKVRRKDDNDIRGQTNVSKRGLTHTWTICGEQGHKKLDITNTQSKFRFLQRL